MKTLACLLTVVALALAACSTWKSTTYKAVGTTVITADTAMQAWGRYVATGRATDSQQDHVRAAYGKYQAAMLAVIDAGAAATLTEGDSTSALQRVVSAAAAAQAHLAQIINAFLPASQRL